jgi:integrase
MARRAHGDGSVYYDRAAGKWVGSVSAGRDPDTGKRIRRKVSGSTKTEAKDRLAELRDEMRKTGAVARRDVTTGQVVQALVDTPPSSWRSPNSLAVYQQHATRIIAALGTVPVVKLTPRQVEGMLGGMARDGMATSTIVRVKATLARALRRAQRDGLVVRNVAELADAPRGKVRKSRSMTITEIGQLLGQKMTPWWRAYLTVAIGCGLRPGELLGLKWEDLDLDKGTISVRHTLHAEPGPDGHIRLLVADLKTASSRRVLRMPAATVEALKALRAHQAAARLKSGARWQDHGLVFCGSSGKPMWPEGIRAGFRRLCERAGLGSDWHPHEQRHTFVSVLSDAGESIESIAAAAGHQSSGTTKRVYWHAISPEITSAATAMDGVLGTSPEEPS